MTYPDGSEHIGQFRYGTRDGNDKMTYPGGKIEDGVWKDDKFLGASKSSS
jgi:hypothetical protein